MQNGIAATDEQHLSRTYQNAQLQKFTIAPQLSMPGGFWARPQLRLFATYAVWNDESKGEVGQDVYKTATKGWSAGTQIEAWW